MKRAWTSTPSLAVFVAIPATIVPFFAGLTLGSTERAPVAAVVVRAGRPVAAPLRSGAALAPPIIDIDESDAPETPQLAAPPPTPVYFPAVLVDELATLEDDEVETYTLREAIRQLESAGLPRASRALLDAAIARWPADEPLQEQLRAHDAEAFYGACERAYRLDPTDDRRARLLEVWCEDELHDREAALCREGLATQEPWALERLAHADPAALLAYFDQYAAVLGQRPEALAAAAEACDALGFDERASALRDGASDLADEQASAPFAAPEAEAAYYRGVLLATDDERPWELQRLEQLAPDAALEVARARARRAPCDGALAGQEVALLHRQGLESELATRLAALETAPGPTQVRAAFELFNNSGEDLKPAGARLLARAYARGAAGVQELALVAQVDPALALSVVRPQLPPEVLQAVLSHVAAHPETSAGVAAGVERVVEAPAELIRAVTPDVSEALLVRALLLRPEDAEARAALEGLRVAQR